MTWMNEDFEDLDNPATYAVDPSGVYNWIEQGYQKLEDGRKKYFDNPLPEIESDGDIREVLICGMGGSAIAGDIAYSIVAHALPVPLRVIRGYQIPASLNKHTLLIVISYSGNTEEAIWAYSQGHNHGACVVGITTGGGIKELSDRHRCPLVVLPSDYPAPRLALTHLLPAVLSVLAGKFDGLDFIDEALADAVTSLKHEKKRYSRDLEFGKNFAKSLAYDIHNTFPVIVSSELTWPVAMRFAAQLNENAKWPAHVSVIPEMNHNEIVAYAQAGPATKKLGVLFLRDKEDHPRVQFRQDFTRELIKDRVSWIHQLKGEGKTALARLMTMLQTADYTSYYLAVARGLDPMNIRAIDILKDRLGKLK